MADSLTGFWWYGLVGKMHGEPRTRHYLGVDLMPVAA